MGEMELMLGQPCSAEDKHWCIDNTILPISKKHNTVRAVLGKVENIENWSFSSPITFDGETGQLSISI